MILVIGSELLLQIHENGERAYPEESAGFLLGNDDDDRTVRAIFALPNVRETGARNSRYLIDPAGYMQAELEAQRRSMEIIGVFHSHPDHPDLPSAYDREWAQPKFSYLITSVDAGRAATSRSWRLKDDRTQFLEEQIRLT